MIVFDEESHTYTNTELDIKYISVTTLLGKYKKPFDSDGHSKRVAAREGVSQEMVLELWATETKKATDKGTKIHKLMEDFIKNGITRPEFNFLYKSYDDLVRLCIGNFKTVKAESLLYNHDYCVAGMSDIIYENTNDFTVADFKTNKKFKFTTDFNDFFIDPVSHLTYCEFNMYALQLSMYAYMHELVTGKKCKKLVVFYLNQDKWIPYHLNYMKTDIINIFKHYKIQSKNLI
jgi:ATP-dependent exoDNAse (exonuclease V) beta subunit